MEFSCFKTFSLFEKASKYSLPQRSGFPGGAVDKESACNPRDCLQCRRSRFDPWVRKILWRGNGNPLQYSNQENPMDRGAWRATVHRVAKSWMQLSTHIFIYFLHLDCLELCIQETLLCGLSYLSRGGIVLIRIICPKPESSTKCMIRKKKKKFMFIYL